MRRIGLAFVVSMFSVVVFASGHARAACVGGAPNGVKEGAEQCDGGTNPNDCCSDTCNYLAENTTCDDGDQCTSGEYCDQQGKCRFGNPVVWDHCAEADGHYDANGTGSLNGTVDGCEQCDGGSPDNPNDCCDANCHFEPQTHSCYDGDDCNEGAHCDSQGKCRFGTHKPLDHCEGETQAPNGIVSGCEQCDNGSPDNPNDCCDGNCNFLPRLTSCDDGDPCTDNTTCDSNGDCRYGTPHYLGYCYGGAPDGVKDHCEACDNGAGNSDDCCTDNCTFEDDSHVCQDGDPCTGPDHCNDTGKCRSGPPIFATTCVGGTSNGTLDGCEQCDGGPCCDSTCHYVGEGTSCDDGNGCTSSSTCDKQGSCRYPGPYTDGCVGGAPNGIREGCEQCDTGLATDQCCTSGCAFASTGTACDDGNVCSVGTSCDAAGHCRYGSAAGPPPVGCDDGNVCTSSSTCDGKHCGDDSSHRVLAPCSTPCASDNNPCTFDFCDGETLTCYHDHAMTCSGVTQDKNGTSCEDGNPCTNTVCNNGLCNSTVSCNTGAACPACGTTCNSTPPKCNCTP